MSDSASLRHDQCPRCAALGHDRHHDNLAIYSDGHVYCFKCGYYRPGSSQDQVRTKINNYGHHSTPQSAFYQVSLDDHEVDTVFPPEALGWLHKYSITDEEIYRYQICYDHTKDLLILPSYHNNGMVSYTGRYFGKNPDHPKYISRGDKTAYMHLFGPKKSSDSPLILVEDFISAIRIGRQFSCIPLFGTNVPQRWFVSLSLVTPRLLIWLDFNAYEKAMKLTQRARQWIPNAGIIITEKDPKEYTDKEINEFVSRSCEVFSAT